MKFFSKKPSFIYLDHASTTPVDSQVLELMYKTESEYFANPSSIYSAGMDAKKLLSTTRKQVADMIHARPQEIVFTGSGTEADNLAVIGIVRASRVKNPHVIVSAIEHPAILEAVALLEGEGAIITKILPNEEGIIDPKEIKQALTTDTVLVSIMHANNEIGVVQPLKEIGHVIRQYRHEQGRVQYCDYPYFHTDASQSPNYLDINRELLGVDLMTLDASKIYGPKGIGLLYIKEGVPVQPIIVGGGQEGGMRAGTENLSRIVGFAKALEMAVSMREKEAARLKVLQDYFFNEINTKFMKESTSKIRINGSKHERLPNNINVCFPGTDAEFLVIQLDREGIRCSAASACNTLKDISGSYVIEVVQGRECGESSLRFTMGRGTKKADIDKTLLALQKIIKM